MNLGEFLKYRHIEITPDMSDKEEDEMLEMRSAAVMDYLYAKDFMLEDGDIDYLEDFCMVEVYEDEKRDYVDSICSRTPWYVETWLDQDLIIAMDNEGVALTKKNLNKFREYCKDVFDDKSERNELLSDMAYNFRREKR